jgi:redox-sensitive bicupin YhaK (pirin superfamily)
LTTAEPFSCFDIRLRSAVLFELPHAENAIVYVVSGFARVVGNGHVRRLEAKQALAFQGMHERAVVQLIGCAQLLVLCGRELREPMVSDGPFIMNYPWQLDAAFARYHAGEMGRLEPIPLACRGSAGTP